MSTGNLDRKVYVYAVFSSLILAVFFAQPCWAMPPPEEIRENFRKDPRNALRDFPVIPLESTAGIPQAL